MFGSDLYMKIIRPIDWAIILWASVSRGLLSVGAGPKPMVPTMPPFFLLGKAVFLGWENKTFVIGLVWGRVDY